MELKNIEQIEEGMIVFMPSGIQATLHKDGEDVLVEYPEMYQDRYKKKDFEQIINEGIIIFNQPSVIIEGYEQEDCPEGTIKKALDEKPTEVLTPEFKNELLDKLTKIAKEYPDVHVRQQALTFIDELGLQEYYDTKAIEKFIKDNVVPEKIEEALNEDNADLTRIANQLADGNEAGFDDVKYGNWKLETSLDTKWNSISENAKNYILEKISNPVKDGHEDYTDLELVLHRGSGLSKGDLESLELFDEEQIINILGEGEETAYISYEIKYDGKLEEAFKEKNKKNKKKKLDEINKEEKMEIKEDCYKVYNALCPDCEPACFNSWNEIEEYLNTEWGSYKADRCKENNSFGSDADKEEFMAAFDIAFIEPEVVDCEIECDDVCPECGEEVCVCEDPAEAPMDIETEQEIEDEAEIVMESVSEMCMEGPRNPEGQKYSVCTDKDANGKDYYYICNDKDVLTDEDGNNIHFETAQEAEEYLNSLNEEFNDNMGMITDVKDLDMPDALKATVPTTKDGEILTPDKYAQEIEELKDMISKLKSEFLTEIKSELKTILNDVKNDLKTDVNDVENKVDDTQDAIEDLVDDTEIEAEVEEETAAEEAPAEEEQVEESFIYVNPFKSYMRKGLMEDLVKTKSEVDKLLAQGKSAEEVKDTITLLADDEKEAKEASQYAADKLKESLLSTSYNAALAGLPSNVSMGLTIK